MLALCSALQLAAFLKKTKKTNVSWFSASMKKRNGEWERDVQGLCKAEAVNQGLTEWVENRQ